MLSILHTSVIQIIKLFPVTGGMLNRDHILFSEALFRFAPAVMKADLIDMCFHASVSRPPNKSTSLKSTFLYLNQNICCEYSKEPSQRDGSFEHTQHLL